MTIDASLPVLSADGAGLVDRWRDMGPTLWLVAAGLVVAWLVALGLLTALTDPRRVRPGAATLEVQGPEPPAVVNLITTDWDLGHEAVPATLVDLAARRHLEIDLVGGRTYVQARRDPAGLRAGGGVTRYDEMVLGHVRTLAGHTQDGRVPGEALTTGPDESSRSWWADFRAAVVDDARARGLSRPRWSARLKAVLVVGALPVALAIALAVSTVPDDPADEDDDPAGLALVAGGAAFLGMSGVAGSRSGERDTPAGRAAAQRWLGLRELLEEDPLFAEQAPAAVAIWDHLLAHGTALGVAHGVVQALPLGAESEREAWSSVGGRWRVVRIRYPRGWYPPGYGRHPGLVTLLGLVQLAIGLPLLPLAQRAATSLRESVAGGALGDESLGTEVPTAARIAIGVGLAAVTVLASAVAVRGGTMTLVGLADLLTGRRSVEGRVLRLRDRSTDKRVIHYLAVDDGTTDRVRAWRFHGRVPGRAGDTVRAQVTRRLQHAADLEIVSAPAAVTAAEAPASATPTPTSATADGGNVGTAVPPALPDDETISTAAGRPLARDTRAAPHPAALGGASAIYRAGDDGHVQVVWVPEVAIDVYRRLPAALRHDVPGLGEEGYRARFGGGVMARRGDRVVMVTPHLPGLGAGERGELAVRVAGAVLDQVDEGRRRTTGVTGTTGAGGAVDT